MKALLKDMAAVTMLAVALALGVFAGEVAIRFVDACLCPDPGPCNCKQPCRCCPACPGR